MPSPGLNRRHTAHMSSRDQVLDAAAMLFGKKGYAATSVREIAAVVGMSAPALYHHFSSKEEIFCATHEKGMELVFTHAQDACAGHADPWKRFEAAAVAHCEALLSTDGYRTIITPHFPDVSDSIRVKLIQQRDRYETFIKQLIAELELPPDINPVLFRMHFLGAINWTTTWYRPGGSLKPDVIARQFVRQIRYGIGGTANHADSAGRAT